MKYLIVVGLMILASCLGFWWGQEQARPAVIDSMKEQSEWNSNDQKNWLELKAKLEGVTADEIREYLRTQNADEKLKKADEILGKIVQALIANVSLRLTPTEVTQFQQSSNQANPDNQPKAAPTPIPVAEQGEAQARTEKPKSQARELLEIRRQARQAANEEEAKKVLDQLAKDYAARLQSSGTLNRQQIRELRGSFDGVLTYDKDGSSVKATLSFYPSQVTSEKVSGRAQVQIFDRTGQAVSTSNSNGDLFKSFTGTQISIFAEIGRGYVELIYFPNLDSFLGNYIQSEKGGFVKIGVMNLKRVN